MEGFLAKHRDHANDAIIGVIAYIDNTFYLLMVVRYSVHRTELLNLIGWLN